MNRNEERGSIMENEPLYWIRGTDDYLIENAVAKLRRQLEKESGEEIELSILDADELDPAELRAAMEFSPLFFGRRLLVIKKPFFLGKSRRKNAGEEVQKVLEDYLRADNAGQVVVITTMSHNSTSALVKWLEKRVRIIDCEPLSPQKMATWVEEQFSRRRTAVSRDAVRLLAASGNDMYYLHNLIEKLCLAAGPSGVGAADVQAEMVTRDQIKVFKLTDALGARDLKGALRAHRQLLEQGEAAQLILHMVVRHFNGLGKVKYYQEQGYDSGRIASEAGLKGFQVKRMLSQARLFTWAEMKAIFASLLDTDLRLKSSGQDPAMLMELLIHEVCNK